MQNISNPQDFVSNSDAQQPPSAYVIKPNGGLTAASKEAHNFLKDIEDLVTSMTSLTGEDLTRAKARLGARVAAARASMDRISGSVADGARKSVKATNGYVHENPWQAIGIGAAMGVVIGLALSRRL